MEEHRMDTSLTANLEERTLSYLRLVARGCYLKGYSKMKKQELVEALAVALMEPQRMEELIYVLDENSWDLLCRAARSDGPIPLTAQDEPAFQLLTSLCYLAPGPDHTCYLPRELRTLFHTLAGQGIVQRKARYDLLHRYAMAAVHLYGAIPLDEFISLFNRQNQEKTNRGEVSTALSCFIDMDMGYAIWEQYLIHDSYTGEGMEFLPELLEHIQGKPRYIPQRAELLRYANWDYFESTPAAQQLYAFFTDEIHLSPSVAQDTLLQLQQDCMIDAPMQQLLSVLEHHSVHVASYQVPALGDLLMNLSNTTRHWYNKGHTPLELSRRKPSTKGGHTVEALPKIGRNDPCPCGSGKKYKKCCGR